MLVLRETGCAAGEYHDVLRPDADLAVRQLRIVGCLRGSGGDQHDVPTAGRMERVAQRLAELLHVRPARVRWVVRRTARSAAALRAAGWSGDGTRQRVGDGVDTDVPAAQRVADGGAERGRDLRRGVDGA